MARRKDHTRAELKEMAILSGVKIIKKQGINELSMRKISKDMGYTVGTLYNVFKHFDDLMLNINAYTLDKLLIYIQENTKENTSGANSIKKLARLYIQFAEKNTYLWHALTSNNYAPKDGLPDWYLVKINTLFAIIEDYLKKECNNKKLIKRSARILWASTQGICVLGLSGKLNLLKTEPIHVLTDTLIDNYITGLKD